MRVIESVLRRMKIRSAEAKKNLQKLLTESDLPDSRMIRRFRPEERGLLLIYFPAFKSNKEPEKNYGLKGDEVVGFAVSFPGSDNDEGVECLANSVFRDENNL